MKTVRTLFLLAGLLCGQAALHAQFIEGKRNTAAGNGRSAWTEVKNTLSSSDRSTWSGIRFSYDRSILKSTGDYSNLKQGFNGFTLSYVKAWNISKRLPLFVEAGGGLSFSRHSFDNSEGDITLKTSHNLLGLYIPANVVYKINLNDKVALKPYTGIYLRLGLLGKEKYEAGVEGNTASDSYSVYSEDGCDWKRFQAGWQIGLTAGYRQYNFGIGYGIDFNKMAPDARYRTFSLRLGLDF